MSAMSARLDLRSPTNGVEPWPTANNTAPSRSSLTGTFIRSVEEADVAWFDANLATDFFNTNPDGTFIDRKAFLAQIARGSSVKNIREHEGADPHSQRLRDHPRPYRYQEPDGTEGAGRYTDD